MKSLRFIGGMAWIVAWVVTAQAQPSAIQERIISVPEVEARSGPSPNYYPTSKLKQGDRVRLRELPPEKQVEGWLAIEPPPGSFSWVNARLVKPEGPIGRVEERVPVLVGSTIHNAKPNVQQVFLEMGSQVVFVGPPKTDQDGIWLPIQPHLTEVRWIPASAVQGGATVETFAAHSAPPDAGTPAGPVDDKTLLQQARQAEQAGNFPEAERLYLQLSKQTTDHSLVLHCLNHAQAARERNRGSTPPGYQPNRPDHAYYAGQAPRPLPAQVQPYTGGASFRPAVRDTSQQVPGQLASRVPPPAQPSQQIQASGPGRLERAGFSLDSQPTYVLDAGPGKARLYVTPWPGLNLEPYVQRNINLYGTVQYRGDLRNYHMTVTQVVPLQ
ncbi:MAG: hypothetical protein ACK4RK_00355 [Gemmataceae bacterium]